MNKTINFTLPTLDHARRFAEAVNMLPSKGYELSENVNAIVLKFAAHCAAEMLRINETENLEGAGAFTEDEAAEGAIVIIKTLAMLIENSKANPRFEEYLDVVFDPYACEVWTFDEMTVKQAWQAAQNHASRLHISAGGVWVQTFRACVCGDTKTLDEIKL